MSERVGISSQHTAPLPPLPSELSIRAPPDGHRSFVLLLSMQIMERTTRARSPSSSLMTAAKLLLVISRKPQQSRIVLRSQPEVACSVMEVMSRLVSCQTLNWMRVRSSPYGSVDVGDHKGSMVRATRRMARAKGQDGLPATRTGLVRAVQRGGQTRREPNGRIYGIDFGRISSCGGVK